MLRRPVCDICGRSWDKVASQAGKRVQQIDHCHICDRVRGVLCIACNYYVVGALKNNRYATSHYFSQAKHYIVSGGRLNPNYKQGVLSRLFNNLGCICDTTEADRRLSGKNK